MPREKPQTGGEVLEKPKETAPDVRSSCQRRLAMVSVLVLAGLQPEPELRITKIHIEGHLGLHGARSRRRETVQIARSGFPLRATIEEG